MPGHISVGLFDNLSQATEIHSDTKKYWYLFSSLAASQNIGMETTAHHTIEQPVPLRQSTDLYEQYWYLENNISRGPHNASEILELLQDGLISKDTFIWKPGLGNWAELRTFQELAAPPRDLIAQSRRRVEDSEHVVEEQVVKAEPTEEEKESQKEDEAEVRIERKRRHHLLRQIRSHLDSLWECQRESIIARIKDEDLHEDFEAKRREHRDIYQSIEKTCVGYWRKSGLLRDWISELTWQSNGQWADYSHKLRGNNWEEKYADMQWWLEHKGIAEYDGCYCFKRGTEYLYIGQAGNLGDRIKQRERDIFFELADSVRVVIPRDRRWLNKLERLLILAHQPDKNRNDGVSGNNPADDCLQFIRSEIQELVVDWE